MASITRVRKAEKTVDVIARIEFKKTEHAVLYIVRSSNGETTYETTLVDGHATGCTCPARKPCYHMTQLEKREAARSTDVQQHVQDDVRTHGAEYASCYGCGQRVRHEGYCHKCA